MPTYEYQCRECRGRVEAFQKMTDDPLTTCADCGGSLRRIMFPVGIVFKGAGFYVNDYKNKETGGNGKSRESSSSENKPAAEKSSTEKSSGEKGSSEKSSSEKSSSESTSSSPSAGSS